jgi:hypothetical protein
MPIVFGQVGNISNVSAADGANLPALAGKAGEIIDAKLHGDYYTANYRGLVYQSTTLTAGTTIPVQATNLVSTFTIWNPLGSGVVVELIRYSAAFLAATTVVSDISLWLQTAVGGANVVPASLTALAVRPGYWSSAAISPTGANKAGMYSAATLVNTVGTNMFRGPTLSGPAAVTSTQIGGIDYMFQGTTLLGPGTLATTAGFAAQTSAASQTLIWAEFPL